MNLPLVTIITPIYNQSEFIADAINSVLNQSYTNWELIIVNDGSVDRSEEEIKRFSDKRIRYFCQKNKGVSAARNLALKNMNGQFFCFLDADDVYPKNSVLDRLNLFQENKDLSFVDGKVEFFNINFQTKIRTYLPQYRGGVEKELISLSGKCFMGPSWMIKRNSNTSYSFKEGLTHGEDLIFYISIAKNGYYDFVKTPILHKREGNQSAMSNLKGLQKGYSYIYNYIVLNYSLSFDLQLRLKYKITRIMFLSYLKRGEFLSAVLVLFKL